MDENCPWLALLLHLAFRRDLLQIDHQLLRIMLRIRQELGGVEGEDVIGNDVGFFAEEVGVVDPKVIIKPVDLTRDEFLRDEAGLGKDAHDGGLLGRFEREGGRFVAAEEL